MEQRRFVEVEQQGAVTVLTLNRPEKANAYHRPMMEQLAAAIAALGEGDGPVLVRAAGRSFCAGADLDELAHRRPGEVLDLRSQAVFERLARLGRVTIAAVQGPAVAGGFELALACDLRVASTAARFWLPETRLGIVPAAGGTQRLKALVGIGRAKEIILGGRELDAETALAWGLVARVVPPADLAGEASRWAGELAGRDALAMRLAKDAIDLGEGAAGLRMETLAQAVLTGRRAPG